MTNTGTPPQASVTFGMPASGDAQVLLVGSVKVSATTITQPTGFSELQDSASPTATNGQSLESSFITSAAGGGVTAALSQAANWAQSASRSPTPS